MNGFKQSPEVLRKSGFPIGERTLQFGNELVREDVNWKEEFKLAAAFTLFVASATGFILYRMLRRKRTPSNEYTPFDDIAAGRKDDGKKHPGN